MDDLADALHNIKKSTGNKPDYIKLMSNETD